MQEHRTRAPHADNHNCAGSDRSHIERLSDPLDYLVDTKNLSNTEQMCSFTTMRLKSPSKSGLSEV